MVILVIFCPVLLCSTKLFMDGYRAHNCNGVLRPASLISQLPKINESFQPGIQQCAAEFFQDYTQAVNITTLEYYNNGIVPSKCDTSFLKVQPEEWGYMSSLWTCLSLHYQWEFVVIINTYTNKIKQTIIVTTQTIIVTTQTNSHNANK